MWEEAFCFLFPLSLSLTHISTSFSYSSFLGGLSHTPRKLTSFPFAGKTLCLTRGPSHLIAEQTSGGYHSSVIALLSTELDTPDTESYSTQDTHTQNIWNLYAISAAKSPQSSPTLYNPIDSSPPGSAVRGILQARTLEWVAISLSNAWKWKVKVKSLSRVQPSVTPWTAAYQTPPSMGFSRQEYWSRVPLPSPSLATVIFFSFVLCIQNARIRTLVPAHLSHAFKTNPHWKKRKETSEFFLVFSPNIWNYLSMSDKEKSSVSSWQLFFHLLCHSPIKCRIPELHLHTCIWICIVRLWIIFFTSPS